MATAPPRSLFSAPDAPAAGHGPARPLRDALLTGGLPALALLWCYAPTLAAMAERWRTDPQYSHGFLVPVFAAIVLWSRRGLLRDAHPTPNAWGLAVLLAGVGLRQFAVVVGYEPLDGLSLLPALAGLVLLLGGPVYLRWAWPALAFLGFMLPLPHFAESALAQPLRRLATLASTYILQTLGVAAIAEGNVILIGEVRMGVAHACSGLGMLMTFFALSTALALIAPAPLIDRLVLVASAVPVAALANVVRITATGLAYACFGKESDVPSFVHTAAGWLMMPLALGLLWLEMRYLARLFVTAAPSRPPTAPGAAGPRTFEPSV